MFFFYDAADALFEFMQKGGDVLYLIGLLAFLMWFLIFERLWYFRFNHPYNVMGAVEDWSKRKDKKTWNSKAIREMLISQTSTKINQNLTLIKFAVTIKKIKRINTTSNIGVKLISSSASVAWLMGDLLIIITFIIQKLSALTRALLLSWIYFLKKC